MVIATQNLESCYMPKQPKPDFLNHQEYLTLYGFEKLHCQHTFHTIEAAGFEVKVQTFVPAHPKGQIFLLHGFTDHIGSYRKIIDFLLRNGLSVVAHDHPGHGMTSGPRGEIDDFKTYADVAYIVNQTFKNDQLPQYLMAHSMGGAVTLELLKAHPALSFETVFLLAPLVRICEFTKKRLLFKMISPLKKSVDRSFSINSNDPVFMRFLHGFDPLQLKSIPTAWLHAYFKWYARAKKMKPLDHRFAIVTGTSDMTVNSQATHEFFSTWPHVSLMSLSGARHHLPGEADLYQQRVQDFLRMHF